ncbi:hypothetical protein PACTADRAFT_49530 [Pachysolen tannophilus NRRL Y-2460]|uniref:Anaphase-promoting complex subunit 4-like WD40 domain-containing protein n=1 Tax=Pachysolen tannophilus NRRL Y-2460 TaxID=669874 RepID=A0A1E4TWS4_PACTA|nr:hypothetical protein PACTADRAFT_49530 [Pachysolen tannophilus NRRL Y-2460]
MPKQYISTNSVKNAHKSDVLGLSITKNYTVTVSSDGYIKLWNLTNSERVASQFVNKLGLHHLSVFEDIINNIHYLIIAVVAFDGKCYFYEFETKFVELVSLNERLGFNNYAIDFLKDPLGKSNKFVSTESNGNCKIYDLLIEGKEQNDLGISGINLQLQGTIEPKLKNFATSVSLDSKGSNIAIGYQNGDVYLYDLEVLKPIYSFYGFGLKNDNNSTTVRSIKFSPTDRLLAVARDSGPYGTITLYDVKYGDTIGTFTAPTHSANVSIGGYAHEGWCFSLDFNEDGSLLASGGFDSKIRIWNVKNRQREATLILTKSDFSADVNEKIKENEIEPNNEEYEDEMDDSVITSVKFIKSGLRIGEGDQNEGLCAVGFDRGIRWYREAGGISKT